MLALELKASFAANKKDFDRDDNSLFDLNLRVVALPKGHKWTSSASPSLENVHQKVFRESADPSWMCGVELRLQILLIGCTNMNESVHKIWVDFANTFGRQARARAVQNSDCPDKVLRSKHPPAPVQQNFTSIWLKHASCADWTLTSWLPNKMISLILILGFLCRSSSWRPWPHIGGCRLVWPLLRPQMTVLDQFFCKICF